MNPTPVTPTGILIIDKPAGWTSMDVCARIRSLVRKGGAPKRAKVGHAGTLDPFATGLLLVMVGRATRLCDRLMATEKEYLATIDLSRTSDTQDPEGAITDVPVSHPPDRSALLAAARSLTGEILQRPPAHSAIHVGGVRAYALARQGHAPDLPPRPVSVHQFEVLEYSFPFVRTRIRCGKGTYIRSLARDLGLALGVGGMLTELRRTSVGEFTIDRARTMESLGQILTQEDLLPIPPGLNLSPDPG
jgi:tRNA pseudouridine55 synthase